MPRRPAPQSPIPDLPALVVLPTCDFKRPRRPDRRRQTDNADVPQSARIELLEATASLLSLIVLVESFFGPSERKGPPATWLRELRSALGALEDAIMGEWLDSRPNADTNELATILELHDSMPRLPMTSAGRKALAFFWRKRVDARRKSSRSPLARSGYHSPWEAFGLLISSTIRLPRLFVQPRSRLLPQGSN